MKRALVLIASTAMVAACANTGANYRPLVDSRGGSVDMNRYEADLRDCQQYAQQTTDAATGAVVGAAAGALLGLALAAAAGSGYDRHASARVGAVAGALSGAGAGEFDQREIIRRCMAGRGYSVLR